MIEEIKVSASDRSLIKIIDDANYSGYGNAVTTEIERLQTKIAALEAEVGELRKDKAYLSWKLQQIIPLFQEARDALPAITNVAARLNNISLSLADRMDVAGTATRNDFNIIQTKGEK